MLRVMLLLAVVCTSTMFGQIQEEYDLITHTAYWKVGDERSYKFTIIDVIVQDGDTIESQQTTFNANISIDDLDENGYYVEWERSNTEITPSRQYNDALFGFLEDVTVEIETEKSGELKGISNWEELQEEAIDAADDVLYEYRGIGEITWRAEDLKQSFVNEQNMRLRGFREINAFYSLNSNAFRISQQLDTMYEDSFVYNGKRIDFRVKQEVLDYNVEEGYYMLSTYTEPDPKQFLELVFELQVEQAKQEGKPALKREELPSKLEYYSSVTATLRTDGWVENLTEFSVVSQIGQTNYQTIRIEAQ